MEIITCIVSSVPICYLCNMRKALWNITSVMAKANLK